MFGGSLNLRVTNQDGEWQPRYMEVAAMLFVTCLILTSIVASKIVHVGFLTLSASTFVFPLTCIFGDVMTEVYGFNRTRRIIWIGLICMLMTVFFTWLTVILPPDSSFSNQGAFAIVLGAVPRITAASFVAYVFCEIVNSYIMSRMKIWSKGKLLSLRALASTVAAQAVDSAICFTTAFLGSLAPTVVLKLIMTTWAVKSFYECLVLPFTIWFVCKLKGLEGVEHFDNQRLYVMKFS
jgi:uncharacterized integral membrane protein (TIGR00697 family)